MKVFLGADHRGFELKEKIKKYLEGIGVDFEDLGNIIYDKNDDFADFAKLVAEKVNDGEGLGILFCGSGAGMDIAANKFEYVRSVLGINMEQVRKAREDDDVNVLSVAADYISENEAVEMVDVFLKTEFVESEKHVRRVEKMKET